MTEHPISIRPVTPEYHHPSRAPSTRRRVADVPLALWPIAQQSPPDTARHRDARSALARHIVGDYSVSGDLVIDCRASDGTTLIEAALLGRRAIGIAPEARSAALTESNCDRLLDAAQRGLAEVIVGDPRHLDRLLGDRFGALDLVCMSPSLTRAQARAAHQSAMAEVYAACLSALRPGGLLVAVTKNLRHRGRRLDLAAMTIALGESVGFTYVGHVVVLDYAIRDGALVGRPSHCQTAQVRKLRALGEPAHVVMHEDVICLSRGTPRLSGSPAAIATDRSENADAK